MLCPLSYEGLENLPPVDAPIFHDASPAKSPRDAEAGPSTGYLRTAQVHEPPIGIEPMTFRLQVGRSAELS